MQEKQQKTIEQTTQKKQKGTLHECIQEYASGNKELRWKVHIKVAWNWEREYAKKVARNQELKHS